MNLGYFKKSNWIKAFLSGVSLVGLVTLSFGADADSYDITFRANDDGSHQRAIYFTENVENPIRPDAALIFVHGMQSHAEWVRESGFGDALADQGVDVFAVDRRGSGKSKSDRGHADSPEQLLSDMDQAVEELEKELERRYGINHGVTLHIMANCFGARIVVPYLAELDSEKIQKFESLTLIAPSTHMSKQASYGFLQKLKILGAKDRTMHKTPLQDEWFVGEGAGLDYIQSDELGLREVSTRFLKTTKTLTKSMNKNITKLPIPLMIVVGTEDVMVENASIKAEVYEPYQGVKKWLELESPHSLEFGRSSNIFIDQSADWLVGSGVEYRRIQSNKLEAAKTENSQRKGLTLPPFFFGLH